MKDHHMWLGMDRWHLSDRLKSVPEKEENLKREPLIGLPSITVLIPGHNEERAIAACIRSSLAQTRPSDQIVVVDDGSTDRTGAIIEEFGDSITVVSRAQCSGNKSRAQETGLWFVTGDIVVMTDADTLLDRRFLEEIVKPFADPAVAAVAGYVKSLKHNWLTACREIDYVLGQRIHKQAQAILDSIVVIPGCAAAFRTDIFRERITFDHDTVAEDLDFTYKLHEQGFKVAYAPEAVVYTQDPADLKSYIHQMKRWYRGNWQNLVKHSQVLLRPTSTIELSLAYGEALVAPFVLAFVLALSYRYFIGLVLAYLAIAVISGAYAAVVSRRADLLWYSPLYLIVFVINTSVFLREFAQEVLFRRHRLTWERAARRAIV